MCTLIIVVSQSQKADKYLNIITIRVEHLKTL